MTPCNKHDVCEGFVQGPTDVSNLIHCMVQRGILRRTIRGKYVTAKTR